MLKFNHVFYGLILILCVQCQSSTSGNLKEKIGGIKFEMNEVKRDFMKEDSPKDLVLSVDYEKPEEELEEGASLFDRRHGTSLEERSVDDLLEMVDTSIIQLTENFATQQDTSVYNAIMNGKYNNYGGTVTTNGFGVGYRVKLDEATKELVFSYYMQFRAIAVAKEKRQVALSGIEDVKKFYDILIRAKAKMDAYNKK